MAYRQRANELGSPATGRGAARTTASGVHAPRSASARAILGLQRSAGNRETRRLVEASSRLRRSPSALQRLCYFDDVAVATAAQNAPPQADVVWLSPLLGVNHGLYPDAPTAGAAVEANLGVAGAPTHQGVSQGDPASEGSYDYWYDEVNAPTQLKGRPTHTSDPTNWMMRVSAQGWEAYGPIVHNHAADYPNVVNSVSAWGVMANTDAVYGQNAGAYDHYLHKPGGAAKKKGKFNRKIPIKATQANSKKKVVAEFENLSKTVKV